MKPLRRVLPILLATMMITSSLVACSSGTPAATTTKAPATTSAAATSTAKTTAPTKPIPVSINPSIMNWVLNDTSKTVVYAEWIKRMEAYLGTKLDIKWNNIAYRENAALTKVYMAGGQFDDIFIAMDEYKIQELGDAGMLVNVMDYVDSLKNYKPWLDDNYNYERMSTVAGKVYGFGNGEIGTHNGNQQAFIYREDIFIKNNIKIPATMEEYYQAAKKLKSLYPDSYPIGGGLANGLTYNLYTVFLQLNKTSYELYYNGKEYVLPPVNDAERFKEVMTYLNKMYAENLIDPEFMTQTNEQGYERMLNGRNFMVPDYWTSETGRINNVTPGVKWCFAARPLNNRGEVGWKAGSQWKGYRLYASDMSVISTKAKNIDILIKLLDYQYSPEMIDLVNWGIEGTTYTKVNGAKQFVPAIRNATSPRAAAAPFGLYTSSSDFPGIRPPKDRAAWSNIFPSIPVFADGKFFDYPDIWKFTFDYEKGAESVFPNDITPPVRLDANERDTRTNTITPITTNIHTTVVNFITGKKPLTEYDAWAASLAALGDYKSLITMLNTKVAASIKK